uniref:Ig-like domain-containing protein n=1 Tax=Dicentrarchus labrax TaxID=13489 RepID=A0A8P4GKN2_DICLA
MSCFGTGTSGLCLLKPVLQENKNICAILQTLEDRSTQQTVMAAVGEEAHLNCQLMQNKDVVQVTWWKPEGDKTLATSSKYFGPRVNPDLIDKVEFKDAGLQNNSIVIRNLTEQDEGCYHCLFNSYPDGALIGVTCIKLYGKNISHSTIFIDFPLVLYINLQHMLKVNIITKKEKKW